MDRDVSGPVVHNETSKQVWGLASEGYGFPVGIKLIKAPKQKEQFAPESSSPYSTPQPAPKPAPLSAKKSSQAPKQVWLQSCAVAMIAHCRYQDDFEACCMKRQSQEQGSW